MNENKQSKWQVWLKNEKILNRDFKKYKKKLLIRKIEPSSSLSKVHIEKAYHNLDFANFTTKNQHTINKRLETETYYDWVIVISYYAMYHSAMALLYKIGYKATTHLATICVLCKECLGKTLENKDIENISKILELREEEIKEIGKAKERRERASYSGSVSFEKHLAEMTLDDAQKFINKIADILEE
ncbi:HEPN domain-containing protein [Candidatus Woesearchaeota archaeon]|nr:HEPN domain-containing protein [Candidatus Woesearchaeota archaeon]